MSVELNHLAAQRILLWRVGWLLLATLVVHAVALVATGGDIDGPVSLRKPITFAEATWLLCWSVSLALRWVRLGPKPAWFVTGAVVLFGVGRDHDHGDPGVARRAEPLQLHDHVRRGPDARRRGRAGRRAPRRAGGAAGRGATVRRTARRTPRAHRRHPAAPGRVRDRLRDDLQHEWGLPGLVRRRLRPPAGRLRRAAGVRRRPRGVRLPPAHRGRRPGAAPRDRRARPGAARDAGDAARRPADVRAGSGSCGCGCWSGRWPSDSSYWPRTP